MPKLSCHVESEDSDHKIGTQRMGAVMGRREQYKRMICSSMRRLASVISNAMVSSI
jgi:hypothetical protein